MILIVNSHVNRNFKCQAKASENASLELKTD